MNRIEHYHDWLRDAHAMEKQAESMLESMVSRIDNYLNYALVLNNILVKPKTRLFNWKLFLIVMTFHVQSLKIP